MFTQLQIHYPKGSLVTELVAIDHGQYIVRCLVQNEGTTLVTSLAAAQTVEMAEDQAKSRALIALGIDPAAVSQPDQAPVIAENTVATEAASTTKPIASTSVPETPPASSAKTKPSPLPEIPLAEVDHASTFESNAEAFTEPLTFADEELTFSEQYDSTEVETAPLVETRDEIAQAVSWASPDKPSSYTEPQVEPETSTLSATTPIDFSDIIARTNVQLKRLGWTNSQGRDYLVQTYGKRSRQLLTDAELLDFLHHLESEPSP